MAGRHWLLIVVVALLSGGLSPFLVALLKRRPETRQLDAQTTSIAIQGAETTVAVLMQSLERAERREAALEAKLAAREAKIEELENRLEGMSRRMHALQDELDAVRRQVHDIRD